MKTLFLMRHGKSSWDDPTLDDRERPLLDKGIDRAKTNARLLKQSGVRLDAIWTSDAVRAVETAKIVRKVFGLSKDFFLIEPLIYDAGDVDELWSVVRSIPGEFETVLLVGHNPLLTDVANRFLVTPLENMKTAQIVRLDLQSRSLAF